MRLAPRLVLAFGLLAVVSTGSLGLFQREQLRAERTTRFTDELRAACHDVRDQVVRQAEADRELLSRACQAGELVDRTLLAIERGDIDERRVSLGQLVPRERAAQGLDELILAGTRGEVYGGDPRALLVLPQAEVERALRGPTDAFALRTGGDAAVVARCRREVGGHAVALIGARRLDGLLARIGTAAHVSAAVGDASAVVGAAGVPATDRDAARATCAVADRAGMTLPITVSRSKQALRDDLARIDRAILVAVLAWTSVALVVAVLLARSLGRPVAELAAEARKVASGEARPIRVRGSGEIRELALAFDAMLADLAVTRRRLAATSRVAAWREVARRVAHEVKNPLAPIRAAVETLRRLRARNDPAFDEYFDEATRTVLDEVHRIANIVTEFTRFARLAEPRPEDVDVVELARHVLTLQRASAADVALDLVVHAPPPAVRADRDQIVQVLTNLVQNALESVRTRGPGRVVVTLDGDRGDAMITVGDDGPGIAPEIAPRLFEPYATTKAGGTGLGLAISQRIALEHNGELSYLGPSAAGGATFRLVLPAAGPPPPRDLAPPPSSGTPLDAPPSGTDPRERSRGAGAR